MHHRQRTLLKSTSETYSVACSVRRVRKKSQVRRELLLPEVSLLRNPAKNRRILELINDYFRNFVIFIHFNEM